MLYIWRIWQPIVYIFECRRYFTEEFRYNEKQAIAVLYFVSDSDHRLGENGLEEVDIDEWYLPDIDELDVEVVFEEHTFFSNVGDFWLFFESARYCYYSIPHSI